MQKVASDFLARHQKSQERLIRGSEALEFEDFSEDTDIISMYLEGYFKSLTVTLSRGTTPEMPMSM